MKLPNLMTLLNLIRCPVIVYLSTHLYILATSVFAVVSHHKPLIMPLDSVQILSTAGALGYR